MACDLFVAKSSPVIGWIRMNGTRRNTSLVSYSYCYVTWCPLTTRIVASQCLTSRDAALVTRYLTPLITAGLNESVNTIEGCDAAFGSNNCCNWPWMMPAIGIESMVTRARLRYTRTYQQILHKGNDIMLKKNQHNQKKNITTKCRYRLILIVTICRNPVSAPWSIESWAKKHLCHGFCLRPVTRLPLITQINNDKKVSFIITSGFANITIIARIPIDSTSAW